MERRTFRSLYHEAKRKPTPAQAFIKDVAEATGRGENAVRMWVSGRQQPDGLVRKVIADMFGVEADGLFPRAES